HDDDERLDLALREQRVLDDADADGADEAVRVTGEAVQEVEHRVALLRIPVVARRQVDGDALGASADRRAPHLDRLEGAFLADEGGVAWRREAAVEPVRVDVAVDAGETDCKE